MTMLSLSPLPSLRDDALEDRALPAEDGFVDDAVVLALVTGADRRRMEDEVAWLLSADDRDFAGWGCIAPAAVPEAAPDQRRAAAPELAESGLGEPHRGSHRWWLAGLAGAVTTLLASALLLTLATRQQVKEFERISIRPIAPTAPAVTAMPDAPQAATELTRLADDK